ncbi:MAG: hypothetical protein F9K28_07475 [Bacteroidetes bacterium]|nr:MAG: hypothetical protein F9K28_07475 [Bacteroidota bacterium]
MTLQTITLKVPEHIYERAQQVAETTDQPLEAVFLHELETAFLPQLPTDEEAELASLKNLSDDALWTIAREQMTAPLQARMQKLMDKNSRGTITPDEYKELEDLVDRGQRLMLRKSEAAALLTERGYKVTRQALRAHE